jgi:hypothetical protein
MSLLSSIAVRTCRRSLVISSSSSIVAAKKVIPSLSSTARWYTGPEIKVQHYESGRIVDDTYKGTDKYCTQTFNKISQVVRTSSLLWPWINFVDSSQTLSSLIFVWAVVIFVVHGNRVCQSFQRICTRSSRRKKPGHVRHMPYCFVRTN